MDKFSFLTKRIEVSEVQSNGNIIAKFCLCDFSVNANGVQLNRDTVESWMGSLINQPLIGRVGYSGDFTGHNMRTGTVTGADGVKREAVMFDTEAFGTFTDVAIETTDNVDYIIGTAEIWGRYPLVCELIKKRVAEGTLHTSWEILTVESHEDGDIKVIDSGSFLGICMLGKHVTPAYQSSGLLEIAETYEDTEFSDALSTDISNDSNKEVVPMDKNDKLISDVESDVQETPVVSEHGDTETTVSDAREEKDKAVELDDESDDDEDCGKVETSSLTDRDLRDCLYKAIRGVGVDGYISFVFPEDHTFLVNEYGRRELEFIQYAYSIDGNDATISDPVRVELVATPVQINKMLAEKTDALVSAGEKIAKLEAQVAQLSPYREAAEREAAEREAAEKIEKANALKAYAVKSGLITEQECTDNEDIKTMISELNKDGIKQMIADRLIASLNTQESSSVEVSSVRPTEQATMNLYDGKSDNVECDLVSAYINS